MIRKEQTLFLFLSARTIEHISIIHFLHITNSDHSRWARHEYHILTPCDIVHVINGELLPPGPQSLEQPTNVPLQLPLSARPEVMLETQLIQNYCTLYLSYNSKEMNTHPSQPLPHLRFHVAIINLLRPHGDLPTQSPSSMSTVSRRFGAHLHHKR